MKIHTRKRNMKAIIVFVILSSWMQVCLLQQCRQMTVCDDDSTRGGGEKGDVGSPGKAGPSGIKGNKGEIGGIGVKGSQGESCALDGFEAELRVKISELENMLTSASCSTSSLYGRQLLRSGEEEFCDGGWTVFLKRFEGDLDFDVSWEIYKRGFGSFAGDFWIGLDRVYNLTRHRGCKLRVDVWTQDGDHDFAEYSSFSIEDESDNYRLHVAGYSGTAGNGLTDYPSPNGIHDNMQFSTKDQDNDRNGSNCARSNRGGWWYNSCYDSLLTRPWANQQRWDAKTKQSATMKLRCD